MVYFTEGPFADDVPVIVRPPPDDRVQVRYQFADVELLVGLNKASDFTQEGFGVLPGRLDDELAVVPAYILSEEVEPVLDMRDSGLLRRESQSAWLQEVLDQRHDFFQQHFFRRAGDEEVVG